MHTNAGGAGARGARWIRVGAYRLEHPWEGRARLVIDLPLGAQVEVYMDADQVAACAALLATGMAALDLATGAIATSAG